MAHTHTHEHHDHDHHDHDHDHHHGHYHPPAGGGPPPSFTDPGAESLNRALRSGFNVLRIVMLALVVAYAFRGCFRVEPNEQGLIVRFGALRENAGGAGQVPSPHVFGPGSHASLPDPFDQKIRVSVATNKLRIDAFSFPIGPDSYGKQLETLVPQVEKLTPGTHGLFMSGDRNLSHGVLEVLYRVEDAEKFVTNVGENMPEDAERLLRRLSESATTNTVAGMSVERILRRGTAEAAADFAIDIQRRLNKELAELNAGIVVDKIDAKVIEPGMVRQAFMGVSQAQSEREKAIQDARGEREQILGAAAGAKYETLLKAIDEYGAAQAMGDDEKKLAELAGQVDTQLGAAEGQVSKIIREAETEASKRREQVSIEYAAFDEARRAFSKHPQVTAIRLWVRMRNAVLASKSNELMYVPQAGTIEIVTNRNEDLAKEREEQAIRARTGQ